MKNINQAVKGLAKLFNKNNPAKLYTFVINNMPWDSLVRFKKHVAIDHCKDLINDRLTFQKKWWGISGIYKITFLPFRLFTYYGSSSNLGSRLKYHIFNSKYDSTFLGIFLATFGLENFSFTVVELCKKEECAIRENWYLSTFKPLLNMLMGAYIFQPLKTVYTHSAITRARISASLLGRIESEETRTRKSIARSGLFFFLFLRTKKKIKVKRTHYMVKAYLDMF